MRQFLKCLSYGNNVLVVKEDATDLDLTANAMTLWIRWQRAYIGSFGGRSVVRAGVSEQDREFR